ncbi:L-aspartate oxidase [Alkanindiges hydrocarboniclasticus]|uniref:L-aspartate oxidase n=1 Tax=Alkanindiges hydrocarboniclasticus TaxID=1907941 RepID=A0A1S8CXW4_9GAMM|nr:L-aspartate oxidase [Alkanindiges hydrocarboniclasticus]ONG41682.1 L-aspartate oxidase [Alkanindiges hydrocarboniclasticus]
MPDQSHASVYDVIIVGSGAAGLTLALSLPTHLKVAVLAKSVLTEASTYYAQGGVAAVLDETDSVEQHVEDTLIAGAYLCHHDAVAFTVEHGRDAVNFLLEQGVRFTLDEAEQLHLTREGGHSQRRIIHAADATGMAISTTLVKRVRECKHVTLLENYAAIDVITTQRLGLGLEDSNRVAGLYVLNIHTEQVETLLAPFVALACGGASKAYLYTSNPDIATGDGIAMAWRAGCRVANLEFNQFHPTCLYHPQARSFLITEAMRGEGAYLRLPDGERFMQRFHESAELAPRDIVARAIDYEMKRLGIRHVWLDITHQPEDFVKSHFPTLYERLLELGIDITKDMIPVVPAAHYTCGGVMVDSHSQTDIAGLYAIGETSFTGLHGANRMASNSLLECFVYGMSAARHIAQLHPDTPTINHVPDWDASKVQNPDEDVVILQNWDELRSFMWNYVGIVRTTKRLQRALNRIELLKREIEDYYQGYVITKNLIELRNLVLVSEMIVRCALQRHESRGLHYTLDYPDTSNEIRDTVLLPPGFVAQSPIVV